MKKQTKGLYLLEEDISILCNTIYLVLGYISDPKDIIPYNILGMGKTKRETF